MKLCECGCGEPVNTSRKGRSPRFVSGHNNRGKASPLRKRKERTCDECGNLFYPSTDTSRLCSIACRTTFLQKGGGRPREGKMKPCTNCGTMIYRKPSQPDRAFCSPACQYTWMSDQPKEISRPRLLAIERDDSRCRVCGFSAILEVHHILPRHRGGTDAIDNLITLCPNHHAMADRGMIAAENLSSLI